MIECRQHAGLPAEFAPPRKASAAIAAFDTAAEREAYVERIPPGWRVWIVKDALIAIAQRIVDTRGSVGTPEQGQEIRRKMLIACPVDWRKEITGHVERLWRCWDLRKRA
jgi:hypothetical protein